MTNKEYEYIIEQQKEIIKQQKELIDALLVRNDKVIIEKEIPNYPYPYYNTPPTFTCSDMPYCTEAPMDKNKCYTSYSATSLNNEEYQNIKE